MSDPLPAPDDPADRSHPDAVLHDRLATLSDVFRPSAPIDRRDLFRGRLKQLTQVSDILFEKGQHGVLFGERGVGKTSLAAVTADLNGSLAITMRINCDTGDNYATLWDKVIDELVFLDKSPKSRWRGQLCEAAEVAADMLHISEIGPDRVRQAMRVLSEVAPVLVFFDEFDRLADPAIAALMADTIKTLSDQVVDATIIVVGVADDVDTLISEHASIERALVQVRMPRMDSNEIGAIIDQGFEAVGLVVDPEERVYLQRLPQGLPQYAHLVAQHAGRAAVLDGGDRVRRQHVTRAIQETIDRADQTIRSSYHDATASTRHTIYEEVLLACALAKTDGLGYFAPADIRAPLSRIMDEPYDIPRFQNHLYDFCTARGPVLERRGGERRWRYRFRNPIMQPYILMKGLNDSKILALDLPDSPIGR